MIKGWICYVGWSRDTQEQISPSTGQTEKQKWQNNDIIYKETDSW
jgi:hypothetical protein